MLVRVIRELPHKDTQTLPQLQLPYFSHLCFEYFHIISISIIIGYGPLEIRGKLASLSSSVISCWLVALAPALRTVFFSILHGLFPSFVFWAYPQCLLLL